MNICRKSPDGALKNNAERSKWFGLLYLQQNNIWVFLTDRACLKALKDLNLFSILWLWITFSRVIDPNSFGLFWRYIFCLMSSNDSQRIFFVQFGTLFCSCFSHATNTKSTTRLLLESLSVARGQKQNASCSFLKKSNQRLRLASEIFWSIFTSCTEIPLVKTFDYSCKV